MFFRRKVNDTRASLCIEFLDEALLTAFSRTSVAIKNLLTTRSGQAVHNAVSGQVEDGRASHGLEILLPISFAISIWQDARNLSGHTYWRFWIFASA